MKKLLFSLTALVLTTGLFAQKKADEVAKFKIETIDMGKIKQDNPATAVFEVTNIGTEPLIIEQANPTCGCTTPEWEKDKDIPAGGTSIIKVGYNAAAEGAFNKAITITYNDNQTKQITIKGEVWKTPAASAPTNAAANDLKN